MPVQTPPLVSSTQPWTADGMAERRDWIFANVRRCFRRFVDDNGRWLSPPGFNANPDPRVLAQVALPFLHGDAAERHLAECLVRHPLVRQRINACSFTTEYLLAMVYGAGDRLPATLREELRGWIADDLLHYAKKDLQHHGYNDNHVTLATASLILGGQWVGNAAAIEEGRANLLNFRDTFIRRGFMHEMNDCYIPHSLYSTAAVAEYAEDAECRALARDCEARIWADWIGHWHPNLGHKPGPSARDYTGGRLQGLNHALAFWIVFGERGRLAANRPEDAFDAPPPERAFDWNGNPSDGHWTLGYAARLAAHPYHVPDCLMPLLDERHYPHTIAGTHETGHFDESTMREIPAKGGTMALQSTTIASAMPFSAREIFTVQYQEADWAMGTASQRMIGNCPNNNWSVVWRKAAPLQRAADLGQLYCSYTINDKSTTGEHRFQMDPADPHASNKEDVEHWFDNGRYAGLQQGRTALMMYRPRIHERHAITSLATSFILPLNNGKHLDSLWFGDREITDFTGESAEVDDIFIADGPLYIGLRPLLSRAQPAPVRMVARREACWGAIHVYSYQGPAMALEEIDLCRIGGGFLCEVATRDDFPTLDAFRAWFRQGQVVDDQLFFMRQVRYQRPGLSLAMRYDAWADALMYRAVNGRSLALEPFACSGVDPADLPWLTGDVSHLDHLGWAQRQAARDLAPHCREPGTLTG